MRPLVDIAKVIVGDVVAIVTVGPKYLVVATALRILKWSYVKRVKTWN